MLTEMEPGRGSPSVLPLWPRPRRQVSGSPSNSHLVSKKGGLTREGEQGFLGRRQK